MSPRTPVDARARRVLLLGILTLTLALPRAAVAAEDGARRTLHVLFLASDDALAQARTLTLALKRAVRRYEDLELGRGEQSLEVLTATLGCDERPDASCQRRIASTLRTTAYVWGALSRDGADLVADLHLFRDGEERGRTVLRYPAERSGSDDVRSLADRAIAELMGVSAATVTLLAGIADGDVLLDGERAAALRRGFAKVAVPPGEHWLAVRAHGYAEKRLRVRAIAGRQYELLVALEPVATPRARPEPDVARADAGYVALAAGGMLFAGGVYASLRSESDALGVALMSTGALAGGAGLYLLLSPTTQPSSAVLGAGVGARF